MDYAVAMILPRIIVQSGLERTGVLTEVVIAVGVHLGKRHSLPFQKEVSGVLCIVQIVGIVDNALQVAFVITHLHDCFKMICHDKR